MATPIPQDERIVIDALGILESLSVSLTAYAAGVEIGTVVKKPWIVNEHDFRAQYPDHPHAHDSEKMRAADTIRVVAHQHSQQPFPRKLLMRLHAVLCDCCAAVRLSLAESLFYAGSRSSIRALQRLINLEQRADLLDTSKMVLRAARAALGRCETSREYYFPQGMPRVLVISDEIDLVSDLLDVTDAAGAHLYQSHSAIDLIALGDLVVAIVDRRICDPEDWEAYREFLTQLDGEQATPLILIDEGAPVQFDQIDPLTTTPDDVAKLMLTQMLTVPTEANLCKPGDSIAYISKYNTAAICAAVDKLLTAHKEGL